MIPERLTRGLVHHLETAASTNDVALEMLGDQSAVMVWTCDQSAGRGTRGREWVAPKNHVLALSLAFKVANPPSLNQVAYPLLAGIVAYEVVATWTPSDQLGLKWPNDLLLNGRKLAGVLCESRLGAEAPKVVIGIGLNLKRHPALDALPKGYAALEEGGAMPRPETLVERFSQLFNYHLCEQRLDQLVKDWMARCAWHVGTTLTLDDPQNGRLKGVFEGLSPKGHLMLRCGSQLRHIDQAYAQISVETSESVEESAL